MHSDTSARIIEITSRVLITRLLDRQLDNVEIHTGILFLITMRISNNKNLNHG